MTIYKNIFVGLTLLFVISFGLIAPITIDITKILFCLAIPFGIYAYRTKIFHYFTNNFLQRIYVIGIISFGIYVLLLVLIFSILPNTTGLKPTYSAIEDVFFAFILPLLFTLLVFFSLTSNRLKLYIRLFIVGNILCGLFLVYTYHDIRQLFSEPLSFINTVISQRLTGGVSRYTFVNIFTKDYVFFPTIAAILSFAYTFMDKKRYITIYLLSFIGNTVFTILTANRDAILGLGIALIAIIIYNLFKLNWTKKVLLVIITIGITITAYLLLPNTIKDRFKEGEVESELFFSENHDSGSVSIRLTIWKIALRHLPDYWLFGDGPIYANQKLHRYFTEEGYQNYVDATHLHHNNYLYYWQHYGITGILFLLFLFCFPIYIMIKQRKISIVLLSLILLYLVMMMTDIYLSRGKQQTLLFWIYLYTFLMTTQCQTTITPSKSIINHENNP